MTLMVVNKNLNSSVEDLIDPTKNPLDPNDNVEEGNRNSNPFDTYKNVSVQYQIIYNVLRI